MSEAEMEGISDVFSERQGTEFRGNVKLPNLSGSHDRPTEHESEGDECEEQPGLNTAASDSES